MLECPLEQSKGRTPRCRSNIGHDSELQIPGVENAYCKWGLTLGEEWAILNGLGEGITQLSRRGRGMLLAASVQTLFLLHDHMW